MAEVTQSQVEEKLASYVDPYLEKDLVSSKCIKEIGIDGDTASVQVVLGFPAGGYHDQLSGSLKKLVESIDGISTANIEVSSKIAAHKVLKELRLRTVQEDTGGGASFHGFDDPIAVAGRVGQHRENQQIPGRQR